MPIVINKHVSQLNRFLVFRSGDQAFEERADPDQLKTIETVAQTTLVNLTKSPDTRVIVLTGDAGHGKTHLCRVALERLLELDAQAALQLLLDHGGGRTSIGRFGDRDIFVIRDLSEMPPATAALRLGEAMEKPGRVTLVCANEGKLRAVVSESGNKLNVLRESLEETQRSGRISVAPGIFVLDLNHQSVTAGESGGFVEELLKRWVSNGHSWRKCNGCPAHKTCPILENRHMLAGSDKQVLGGRRREGLALVLRVAEQSGTAVTIRETLVLLALAITGGLDCKRVQSGEFQGNPRLRTEHHFYQVLFDPPLSKDELASLSLLRVFRRLDPGAVGLRSVDEALISSPTEEWTDLMLAGAAKPSSRKQMQTEARKHRKTLALLRRRDFFDLLSEDEWRCLRGEQAPLVPRAERLGLRHHESFETVVRAEEGAATGKVRDLLLRGLEAVQDVRRGVQEMTKFSVVDPAYAIVSGAASILSQQVSVKRISVLPQRLYWKEVGIDACLLPKSLDWTDRRISIVFKPPGEVPVSVELDLVQFEFVMRSAEGLASRRFFQGDIRRITSRLAALGLPQVSGDDIMVVFGDEILSFLVEEGGRIRCEGGGN